MIDLVEPMREGNMIRCLLMSQRSERISNVIQRVQGGCKVIPTQFRIQRYNLLEEVNKTSNSNEIIKDMIKMVLAIYTLTQDLNALVC
jgi:ribosome recycling factor